MNNSDKQSTKQRVLLKVCAVLCSIILTINPVKTNAMNPVLPIPPIWLPINPYNTESIVPNAELLNDEQKNILYEIIGAYNHIYLGFGGFVLTSPISGVKQWWREYGETFYNSFVQSVVGSPRALIDMVGSATYKASQYDTLQEFEEEISDTSVSNYIEYNPELTFAFRDWYFNRGGVYQWQFADKPWSSNNFTWNTIELGSLTSAYNEAVNGLSFPHERINYPNTKVGGYYYKNVVRGEFNNVGELVLFLNSTTGYYSVVDLATGELGHMFTCKIVATRSSYADMLYSLFVGNANYAYSGNINLPYFSTLKDAVKYIYDNATITNGNHYGEDLGSLCPRAFVGANWETKQEIFNIDDLDISGDTSTYVDNIGTTGYTDINGLATSLGADIVDIKQGVLDNTLVKTADGTQAEQLTDSLLKAIDKFMTTPSSGVVIPTGIFAPVKGFMEYMWYMTKPLIVFTRDVISTLTFGAADGFLNTGPAIFVFGVCSFGLIGGLIVKCLL